MLWDLIYIILLLFFIVVHILDSVTFECRFSNLCDFEVNLLKKRVIHTMSNLYGIIAFLTLSIQKNKHEKKYL